MDDQTCDHLGHPGTRHDHHGCHKGSTNDLDRPTVEKDSHWGVGHMQVRMAGEKIGQDTGIDNPEQAAVETLGVHSWGGS